MLENRTQKNENLMSLVEETLKGLPRNQKKQQIKDKQNEKINKKVSQVKHQGGKQGGAKA